MARDVLTLPFYMQNGGRLSRRDGKGIRYVHSGEIAAGEILASRRIEPARTRRRRFDAKLLAYGLGNGIPQLT
jgi:hypothetical protein